MKKSVTVPFLPELDNIELEKISDVLEEKAVRQSIECVNWPDQFPYKPITAFSIARSSAYIYIDYFVRGNCLIALTDKDNGPVWKDSCVEFFVQIPGEKEYYNFEFNCIGTALAAKRASRENAEHFAPEKMRMIKRYASVGNKPFEEMQGLFAWELLVAIPFSLLGLDGNNLPEMIKANFFKCADGASLPHFLSWSPIDTPKPDFHRPEFFGELHF
ncbi:MAG: hypothetical protein J1E02_06335 [Coprobacter sp.]|nr:hypothetical protein [Coprobacter sp.]